MATTTSPSIHENYELLDQIGKGAFSTVKLAKDKKTGEYCAVKIIDKSKTEEQDAKRLDVTTALLVDTRQTEVEILKKVKHENIIKLIEIFDTKDSLYLVMDLVTGGELFDKILEKGQYSEKEASIVIGKVLSALDYLHSNGIAHRDLKPENLLLKNDEGTEVMLSDFGLSKIFAGTDMIMATACGTPYYVAPEVLAATGYDKEVDLWSVGVITYLLLCGFPPFFGDSLEEVFELISKGNVAFPDAYWGHISLDAKDFIQQLLVVDPKKRFTASEALKHPWILSFGNNSTTSLSLNTDKCQKFNSARLSSKASLKN